jgi:hypothetical protein
MNAAAQALLNRLTEVEKIKIRAATQDGLVSMYHDYKAALPGGAIHSGTEAEGITAMQDIAKSLNETYAARSQHPGFPMGWLF